MLRSPGLVSLNHPGFTVSGWLGCQAGQSWEVKEKAAAAPAEPAKEVAAVVLTQRKERESSQSCGENGRAQTDLRQECHCQFSQLTFSPRKHWEQLHLVQSSSKIEQVLFQQI